MDSETVYNKTALGEEAMRQRTRVMQRNVRMVLILVDGHSSVADLCRKTGNDQLTENALGELEKGGFIQVRVEQDSLWAESKKVAQEIRAKTIDKARQLSSGKKEDVPVSAALDLEGPMSVHSAFQIPAKTPDSYNEQMSQFSIAPLQNEARSELQKRASAQDALPSGDGDKRAGEPEASFIAKLFSGFSKVRSESKEDEPLKRGRGQRKSISWSVYAFGGLVGASALFCLAILVFPFASYRPEIESFITAATGQETKISGVQANVLPVPGMILEDVRIGSGRNQITIKEMRLLPEISSLFGQKKQLKIVALSGAVLSPESFSRLPTIIDALMQPSSLVQVQQFRFEKTDLSFASLTLPAMEGEVRLTEANRLKSVLWRSSDRSLSLDTVPAPTGLEFSLEGYAWRPLAGSPFVFDSLTLKGKAEKSVVTLSSMDLRIFDGVIQGVALLQEDKKPALSAEISFERINSARFGAALGVGQLLSGELAGKLILSSKAENWEGIFTSIAADGEFVARRGAIRGVDLAEAIRRASSTPVQGGVTQFEQFSGKIMLKSGSLQLHDLFINSGLMQSTGAVEINKDENVSGKMDIQMRGSVNQSRIPVLINGPLKAPSVKIGKR